ncbi:MAG: hypothetical protein KJI69_06525 [Patescibacteria group bacterium]|nr:hypothetical protein [Patescibacteria group bacterium]
MTVELPQNCKEGDKLSFCAVLNDETLIEPFKNNFEFNVRGPIDSSGGKSKRSKPPSNKNGDDLSIPGGIDLPHIEEVHESDWHKHNFDKFSALRIENSGERVVKEDGEASNYLYDFFVNVDNIHLQRYLKMELKREEDERLPQHRFRIGIVLVGLALINAYSDNNKSGENEDHDEGHLIDTIGKTTRAFAPFVLPMIDFLGKLDLEDVENAYFSGDST